MRRNEQQSTMIISTQTPDKKSHDKRAPGNTGLMLQKLMGCGLVKMHRSKTIKTDAELNEFKNHLTADGWVIITGHGGNGKIGGFYQSDDSIKLDITCGPEDYANLIADSKILKLGDHINIILYVCYAAESINGENAAEKLGEELARKGFSSSIYASKGQAIRILDYNNQYGEIEGDRLRFRAKANEVRVITTHNLSPDEHTVTTFDAQIYFTKHGVRFHQIADDAELVMTISKFAGNNFNLQMTESELNKSLNLTTSQADRKISNDRSLVLFHKSQTYPDMIVISYYHVRKNEVRHVRFAYDKQDGDITIKAVASLLDDLRREIGFNVQAAVDKAKEPVVKQKIKRERYVGFEFWDEESVEKSVEEPWLKSDRKHENLEQKK